MITTEKIILLTISLFYITHTAHYAISPIVSKMWAMLRHQTQQEDLKARYWQSKIIGILDRMIFLLSLLAGKGEFIGLWLGLKTVSQYKRWSEDEPGRATFNIFLTGNGLSLLFVFAAYQFIKFGTKMQIGAFNPIYGVLLALILLAPFTLSIILYKTLKKDEGELENEIKREPESQVKNKNKGGDTLKSFFKNNRILILRLVIPLVFLASVSLWISTRYQRDIFVNVATDFISIIITVFYVDWVMRLYDENKWSAPDLYIKSECGALGHGFISDITEHLELSKKVFPAIDSKHFSLRDTQLAIVQRAKDLQVDDFDKSLATFDVNKWKKLDEMIKVNHAKADKLLELFFVRTNPAELTSLFEFRKRCSDITATYSLFKYMMGMPLHELAPLKDGSQNIYGLIATKRTSIDLKRAIDSAINIIETFGFEPKEPDIDYEAEIRKIW